MGNKNAVVSILAGAASSALLLGLYFAIVTIVSGRSFAWEQFGSYWYYLISLAIGFGIQVGLSLQLKAYVSQSNPAGKTLAVTGTTSTAAMISCCAHYAINVIPILGITGITTIVAQYQIQLFWVGLAFNLAGIAFITSRIRKAKQQ